MSSTLKVDSVPYPYRLWTSVAGALIGAFQFGYQVGVLNTALPFIRKDIHYHRDAVLSSAVVLGAACGALSAGQLADHLGPRHAQVFNCLAFLAGSLLSTFSTVHTAFLAGRFIAGIGAGAASLYVPRYIAEVSPPCLRGWLGSLNQVVINAGILAAYCAGIPYEQGFIGFDMLGGLWVSWWRVMCLAAIAPAVLQVLVLSACPESPVWLEGVGKRDAADEACIKLWGAHALLADPDYEADAARAADLVTSASEQLMMTPAAAAAAAGQGLAAPLLLNPGGGGSSTGQRSTAFSGAASTGFSGASPLLNPGGGGGGGAWPGGGGSPLSGLQRRAEPSRVPDGGFSLGGGRSSVGFSSSGNGGGGPGGESGSEVRGGGGVVGRSGLLEGWDGLLARRYRWMMALAVGLPVLQQASGINTVVYYSSKVFTDAGLSSPIAASIITGGVNLAFTVAAAAALDKYGRKPLLLLSYIGMALALSAVAGVSLLPESADTGPALVLLVLVYVAFFAAGSGPVTWVLLSEVLPPRIKGPAASLATAAAWAGNLFVTLSFDGLLARAGLGGTYLIYALLNMAAALWVAQVVVETRCRTLPEIEELLLLPDMDPRLAALLPALQQANSRRSSSGALDGGSPPAPVAGGRGRGGGGGRSPLGTNAAVHLLLQQQYAQQQQQHQHQQLMMHRGQPLQHQQFFAPAPAGYAVFGLGSAAAAAAAARLPGAAAAAALGGPLYAPSNGANSDSALAANVESALLSGPETDLLLSGGGAGGTVTDDLLATRHEFVQGWAEGAAAAAAADAAAAAAAVGQGAAARISHYGEDITGLMSPPDAAAAARWPQQQQRQRQQHDDEELDLGSELPESATASSQLDMSFDGQTAAAAAAAGRGGGLGAAAKAGSGAGTAAADAHSADGDSVVPGAAAAAAAAAGGGLGMAGGRGGSRTAAAAAGGFLVVHGFAEPPRQQQQQQEQEEAAAGDAAASASGAGQQG